MTPFLSKGHSIENKLIGNIVREYPQMAGIMERYFGRHCYTISDKARTISGGVLQAILERFHG